MKSIVHQLLLPTLLLCPIFDVNADTNQTAAVARGRRMPSNDTDAPIKFSPHKLKVEMSSITPVNFTLRLDALDIDRSRKLESLTLELYVTTLSPQFDILSLGSLNQVHSTFGQILSFSIPTSVLQEKNYTYESAFAIQASYIGRGEVQASLIFDNAIDNSTVLGYVEVTSARRDGVLSKIFKFSAISLVVINFFNLGTQIQDDNIRRLWKSPMISILGLIITLTVMPLVSWTLGYLLLHDQLYYRFGAFLIGCCPAASASTFWVLLLKGDTELTVSLVLLSTVASMITMPIWLYTLGMTITQGQYPIKIPYGNLIQTLSSLFLALVIGYIVGKCFKRLPAFVSRVIKPFSFMVLAFFIIFSSIVYWFIYRMFDWKMILLGMAISFLTYLISGASGYLVQRDVGHLVTVAINATHKSSGIAFAVLLIALPDPDYYVAFVPCLAQVLATRSILYSVLTVRALFNFKLSRKQNYDPRDPIKAQDTKSDDDIIPPDHPLH